MHARLMTGIALVALVGLMACGSDEKAASGAAPVGGPDAAAPGTAQAVGVAVRPEDRTFRQWYASCDNGKACAAYTGSDSGGFLLVRQAAGPKARPEILVGASAFAGTDTVEGMRLTIDGEAVTLESGPSDTMSHAVPAGQVAGVLEQLAGARAIRVGVGETQAELPVAGASAAFLWIDEQQGRLDTTTALIRRGSGAASSVPAAPALPRVAAAPAVDQGNLTGTNNPGAQGDEAGIALPAAIEALAGVRQCREDTAYNEYLQRAVLAGRLAADTELWGVPCGSGAYNAMYDIYVSGPDGANPRKVRFPNWAGETPEPQEGDIGGDGLVNPMFDARTNTIRHFPKARGIGDCGIDQAWAWTGDGFVLTEERSMGNCWGMVPDLWPPTWRTR